VHLGSLIEIYVPANTRIKVKPGDSVKAGSDIVATLVHK
jgi:phosphatidylserine decarboxylase